MRTHGGQGCIHESAHRPRDLSHNFPPKAEVQDLAAESFIFRGVFKFLKLCLRMLLRQLDILGSWRFRTETANEIREAQEMQGSTRVKQPMCLFQEFDPLLDVGPVMCVRMNPCRKKNVRVSEPVSLIRTLNSILRAGGFFWSCAIICIA